MARLTPTRKLEELEALVSRYPEFKRSATPALDGSLSFEGAMTVAQQVRHVRLTLPPAYPLVAPQVHEIDPATRQPVADAGRPRRLGQHGICLFPHGDDVQAWRSETGRAVDALDRFRGFIAEEESSVRLFRSPNQLIIPRRALDKLLEEGQGVLECRQAPNSNQLFASALHCGGSTATIYPLDEFPPTWQAVVPVPSLVPWIVVNTDAPWPQLIGSRAALDSTLRASASAQRYEALREYPQVLFIRKTKVGCDERVDACCVEHRPGDPCSVLVIEVVRSTVEELLFNRVDGAMYSRAALAEETVVIVGLGSLGSVTAKALAQAGVSRFVLIDPEKLALENVCRHLGRVADIGRAKVDIVKDEILATNPSANVAVHQRWLAWDLDVLSAGRAVDALLASDARCTLVSTCASGVTETQLNALALEYGAPAIYAAALGAAEHGRVFRVIPGQSPCLQCILNAQDANPDEFPRYVAPGLAGETPPYLQPGLPGLAVDIGQIALLTARFTLQTIAKVRGVDLRLPLAGGDHLLWTNRGDWGFDLPLQLRIEAFPKDPACSVCALPRDEDAMTDARAQRLMALEQQLEEGGD